MEILDRARILRSDLAFCLKIFIENLPEVLNLSSSREISCSVEAESSSFLFVSSLLLLSFFMVS